MALLVIWIDNNGRISIDEIREFVVGTGGNSLDDNKEIRIRR